MRRRMTNLSGVKEDGNCSKRRGGGEDEADEQSTAGKVVRLSGERSTEIN